MKNAMRKDFWREIKHTRSRFFSIMILVALSVAFLSGLKATAPDMKRTGDDYLDSLHLADIQVLSTLGLTDDDITSLRTQDKVEDAEGEYVIDAFASSDSLDAVVKVLSLTGRGINEVLLRDGRMPERADECVVEENMLSLMSISIGDTITLTPGDDLSDALAQDTYTVVGTVRSPVYLAVERGTSTLGSGTVKAYLYLPREAFTLDYYTAAYVRVSGAAEMTAFYSDYDDYIDAVIDKLEPFGDARSQLRHDDLVDEATEKLDDAQKELDDAKAEADEKLGDAQKELNDARRKLNDGWKDYYDGQQELKDARVELDDAKIELDDGEMQYLNGMEEYEDALDEYEKGRAEYEDGLAQYEDGVKELESGERELAAGRRQLESGERQLNSLAKTVTDALPDILKALETAEKHAGDAIDALRQCDKDLTLNAADRAELSAASGRIQTNSAKLKAAANSLNTAVNDLKEYLDGSKTWNTDAVRRLLSDALAALSDAMSVMAEISTDMAKIAAILSDFLKDAAPKAHDDIQQALDALSDAAASLDTATGKTRRLIEDLNARGSLTFYPLGDGYQDTLDSLFTNLRSTMDELDALSDGLSADGSTLTADLRAVNDQMNAVVNLCLDIFVDMTDADASDIFEDTSDENIDAVTFGKVRGCTNYGAVDADLNVGGIAGAMAIEYELDPEGDQKESSSVFDRVYETKAVVQHCVNRGSISGKKDCIGGIVGEMDLGIVLSCEAYGSARSETGSYVGGIAGLSSAGIRSSWAKLTLSGKSSVGGIVGSGSEDTSSSAGSSCTVTDCRSLVVVEDCDQFSGAISGRDLGVFRGNYFVSDTLRGIDRRSLSGQAEPMDYAALCALDGVPEDFLSFTLRFVCDGRTLKTLRFDYGDSFDFSVFPSLTEQSGSYPVWDRTDLTDLRFDTVVTAEYTAYRASLQSDAQRADGRSIFFVEGEFNETDTLTAAAQTPDPNAFPQLADNRRTALKNYFSFLSERTLPAMTVYRSVAEQWELSFPRDALAEHTIRYLPPEEVSMDHCAVFVRRSDGSWQPVETTSMGSYLLFTAEGENLQLAVLTTAAVWWLWAIFLALIAAAVFFIVRFARRRRGKKAAKPSKKENGAAG